MADLPLYDNPEQRPLAGEHFLIPGPAGNIEVQLGSGGHAKHAPIAVICHPHPLHGGSLGNKVVHTIDRAFTDLGAATLRFNFRGVGHSQGSFDHGIGESEDLLTVVAWFRQHFPDASLWLAGFSFGAAMVCRTQGALHPQRLLLVAPPVTQDYFSAEGAVDCPWMVIQGSEDEVISAEAVSQWVQQQENPPDYHCLAAAGHFFHGRLVEVRELIKQAWGSPHLP